MRETGCLVGGSEELSWWSHVKRFDIGQRSRYLVE